jgi:hypothetical protein
MRLALPEAVGYMAILSVVLMSVFVFFTTEINTILENNLTTKDIIPEISKKVVEMFKKLI